MNYLKLKNKVIAIYLKIKYWLVLHSTKTLWLSLGENCLTDSILGRHGLKSFSTIYSHGRSNIDYALFLEKTDYADLLLPNNLKYDILNNGKVVRSSLVVDCSPIFQELQMNGFEFTHHDILQNKNDLESYKRKIKRQLKFKKKKNFIFLYHHRMNESTDLDLLFKKLYKFSCFYSTKKYFCKVIVFSQNIVESENDRKISYMKINDAVHFFNLSTLNSWVGDDDNFWAKNDTDLIEELIRKCQLIANQI